MRAHCSEHSVEKMCAALEVSRSGYYDWKKRGRSRREIENGKILEAIVGIRKNRKKLVYGAPRIRQDLTANGFSCGRHRVARIMSRNGIKSTIRKKWKATTDSRHNHEIADDLVRQDFTAGRINELWTSDITYLWTEEGWLYLAVALDAFSRKIVGWSIKERMSQDLVLKTLRMASSNRRLSGKAIFHSDRGSQYACLAVRQFLKNHGLNQSMGSKGSCFDNAITESFFHSLKVELVYQEKFKTKEEAKLAIFEYIESFYNRERRHSALGYLSPEEFEKRSLLAV